MKRFFALLAVFCLLGLLAGCSAGADDKAPVWQTELAGGGTLSISGGSISEETGQFRIDAWLEPTSLPILHITGKSAPTMTVTGVGEDEIVFWFAEPADDGVWDRYVPITPVEKLDHVLTRGEDGTLQYRFDTVCGYAVAIGPELWILDITREGL